VISSNARFRSPSQTGQQSQNLRLDGDIDAVVGSSAISNRGYRTPGAMAIITLARPACVWILTHISGDGITTTIFVVSCSLATR
jgi:hypothetical protein